MKTFTLVLADGATINQAIKVNGKRITTELELAKLMKANFLNSMSCKSFTQVAKELNETGEYESTFTKYDILDNMASILILNIDGKYVNIYDFMLIQIPFKEAV